MLDEAPQPPAELRNPAPEAGGRVITKAWQKRRTPVVWVLSLVRPACPAWDLSAWIAAAAVEEAADLGMGKGAGRGECLC